MCGACMCTYGLMCRSGDSLQQSAFSSYHVGPKGQTQVVRFGSRCLYLLSHLIRPHLFFFNLLYALELKKNISILLSIMCLDVGIGMCMQVSTEAKGSRPAHSHPQPPRAEITHGYKLSHTGTENQTPNILSISLVPWFSTMGPPFMGVT